MFILFYKTFVKKSFLLTSIINFCCCFLTEWKLFHFSDTFYLCGVLYNKWTKNVFFLLSVYSLLKWSSLVLIILHISHSFFYYVQKIYINLSIWLIKRFKLIIKVYILTSCMGNSVCNLYLLCHFLNYSHK